MKSSDTTDKSQPWAYFFVSLSFGQTPNLLGRNRWAFSPSSRWEGRQESPGASADGNELAKGKGNQKVLCQDSFWPVESYCRIFGSPNIFFKGLGSTARRFPFAFLFLFRRIVISTGTLLHPASSVHLPIQITLDDRTKVRSTRYSCLYDARRPARRPSFCSDEKRCPSSDPSGRSLVPGSAGYLSLLWVVLITSAKPF